MADPAGRSDGGATWRAATVAVTAGRPSHSAGNPVNEPLSLSSTFHAGGEFTYARDGSPSTAAFERAIGALDGGTAVAFASGMAAVAAVLDTLPVGARIVAPRSMYWGSVDLLRNAERLGRVVVTPVDVADTAAVIAALPGAALCWIESPTNPLIDVADVPAICRAAREHRVTSCVDSTFATPLLQRPLEQSADIVMHSATKFISGHSDLLMGVLVSQAERAGGFRAQRARTGASPGALEAFLALRGLRTLDVRLRRQQANAQELAERLADHPAVARVRYPGLAADPHFERATRTMDGPGAILAFELHSAEAADRFSARVELISDATSLGGVESLVERRAKYAGEQSIGTPEGLIRFSVGIEDVADLWADISRALS
jgi:cystathionine gamma-synthase